MTNRAGWKKDYMLYVKMPTNPPIRRKFRFMNADNKLIYQRFKPKDRLVVEEINALTDGSQEIVIRKLHKYE